LLSNFNASITDIDNVAAEEAAWSA